MCIFNTRGEEDLDISFGEPQETGQRSPSVNRIFDLGEGEEERRAFADLINTDNSWTVSSEGDRDTWEVGYVQVGDMWEEGEEDRAFERIDRKFLRTDVKEDSGFEDGMCSFFDAFREVKAEMT